LMMGITRVEEVDRLNRTIRTHAGLKQRGTAVRYDPYERNYELWQDGELKRRFGSYAQAEAYVLAQFEVTPAGLRAKPLGAPNSESETAQLPRGHGAVPSFEKCPHCAREMVVKRQGIRLKVWGCPHCGAERVQRLALPPPAPRSRLQRSAAAAASFVARSLPREREWDDDDARAAGEAAPALSADPRGSGAIEISTGADAQPTTDEERGVSVTVAVSQINTVQRAPDAEAHAPSADPIPTNGVIDARPDAADQRTAEAAPSAPARRQPAARQLAMNQCQMCGEWFPAKRRDAKTCGAACRKRWERRGRELAKQLEAARAAIHAIERYARWDDLRTEVDRALNDLRKAVDAALPINAAGAPEVASALTPTERKAAAGTLSRDGRCPQCGGDDVSYEGAALEHGENFAVYLCAKCVEIFYQSSDGARQAQKGDQHVIDSVREG
jgi:transposase-like protein